ncbi:hypothetical protein HUT16_37130 [Kitasatospora sp. NA04385]|uniref:hypothetical protein n=1 Tax=Kitasatospora sp. NA04385 TaxID=2742135 RepID=UPI00159183EF|nr:hypothetical protein [Kitasatospora sp. NA04385]QKW23961.1 hypothetical protein HUT16_37130 [Kitasatospora sp. NA04385]
MAALHRAVRGGDYAYCLDIAHHMAGQHPDRPSGVRWLEDEQAVRGWWRNLVAARQAHLARP